jgi:hypothetical protein
MLTYLFLFLLLTISILLKKPTVIGYLGELGIRRKLNRLDPQTYTILYDVLIPTAKEGKTSQIDHVVISPYGIFVIETKNYQGWIFGQEKSQYWTQTIYKRKERFFNPILQNNGHIKALKELLSEYTDVPYHNIVVFGGRAKLKVNVTSEVINAAQLLSTIQNHNEANLNFGQIQSIHQSIVSNSLQGKKVRKKHVETIHKELRSKDSKIAEMICPRCEGELVERKGKYGSFLGCSNYPKCRFVVNEKGASHL